jgi:hypothetical protein
MKLLLVLSLPLLTACGAVTPYGSSLVGTDADYILLEGNAKTGEYKMVAKGLNQSRSTERVATTFTELAKIKGLTKFGTEMVDETGSVVSEAF